MDFQIKLRFYRKKVSESMKTTFTFCISVLYILTLHQCKPPAEKEPDAAKTQDSMSIHINQAMQVTSWTTINTDFTTNCLNPFLTSKKITTDCTHCDKIMFSFSFIVDGKGKITTVSKENENISCTRMSEAEKNMLEKEIMIYLKQLILPAPFYNATYQGILGFIYKC